MCALLHVPLTCRMGLQLGRGKCYLGQDRRRGLRSASWISRHGRDVSEAISDRLAQCCLGQAPFSARNVWCVSASCSSRLRSATEGYELVGPCSTAKSPARGVCACTHRSAEPIRQWQRAWAGPLQMGFRAHRERDGDDERERHKESERERAIAKLGTHSYERKVETANL